MHTSCAFSKVVYGFAMITPAIAALVGGMTVSFLAQVYRIHFHHMLGGKPLPAATEFILSLTSAFSPSLMGFIIASICVIVSGSLIYFAPDGFSAFRRLTGFATIAWASICALLLTVLLAFALPMLSIMYSMQQDA